MNIKNSLLFVCLFLVTGSFAQSPKFISTRADQLIGTNGQPFLIKGTNLGNWLVPEGYMFKFGSTNSPRLINEAITELIGPAAARQFWKKYLDSYITQADIRYIRSLGMNSIRVPFDYRLFSDEEYLGDHGAARGFALMDRLIGWCRDAHLYVILDMHCAPGGQTGDNIDDGYGYPFLFEDTADQDQTAAIWKMIAAHYKNEPTVIGYDLLNEPIATYFDKEHFNPFLEPLYKKIAGAIRTVDSRHLLFLGGAQWDSNFKIFGPPFDPKLVYTFHKYWTDTTQEVIQEYLDFRNKYHVPICCGETGENTDAWIAGFRRLLDKNRIGWHFWPYKKMDNTRGIVTFPVPADYDAVIRYADTLRNSFADIRKARPGDVMKIKAALYGFIHNSLFENCTVNTGYVRALGLH